MKTVIGICCLVALFAIVIVLRKFNNERKKLILEEATAITKGQIIAVKFCEGDMPSDCFFYWKVSYMAEGSRYTLKSGDSRMSKSSMMTHIGETVDVHYIPGDPGKAYASVYGVTAWSGAAAF